MMTLTAFLVSGTVPDTMGINKYFFNAKSKVIFLQQEIFKVIFPI